MTVRHENVKWVDGLRGLASLLVVSTHLARAFDEDLFKPTSAEGMRPRIAQYPIIRILFQGRIGVSIFSLVTGYVCALKPIRQFRAGQQEAAFNSISRSAVRRVPRLVIPATIATMISWFVCQLGIYEVGNRAGGWWLNYTSPNMTPWIGQAIVDLISNLVTTWTRQWNTYDTNQWTLVSLLNGSMRLYMMLFATAHIKTRYRIMAELALFLFFYISIDSAFGMQVFFGAFLSELAQMPGHMAWCSARKWTTRILSPILVFIGLLLASYPEHNPEWMPWSHSMLKASAYIFPKDSETPRFYSGIGLEFIALGIHFSPGIKGFLSNKYLLWFGKNSFAVYLLHGNLLRTLLVWMYFGLKVPADIVQADGKVERAPNLALCGRARFWLCLPIWFVVLYSVANQWTKHVDPWCARMTEKFVGYVTMEEQKIKDAEKAPMRGELPK
ncbi:hypothetical protein HYALB_00002667 [Hymenoscyphus albidus]|uniref:Acyltransferase 3 domain-containing protein n=1 Tax=Hymenoscyphus albidus TaxID=595503 RepID=A0A9N9M2X8_9HELO|nr:hypothetical protein HYALB_00002667 [Hymenoscyphus albidus]